MTVNSSLAHFSDICFVTAIAVYTAGWISYCGEYAFSRKRRVAQQDNETVAAQPVLIGAGARSGSTFTRPSASTGPSIPVSFSATGSDPAQRTERLVSLFGRSAMALTILGFAVHAAAVVTRGIAVGRSPWGNMYEFSSVAGLVAVAAYLVVMIRQPRIRSLGMFVMLPVIVLMFLAGTVLYSKAGPLVASLRSYWLAIHVTAATISVGIFLVSGVASLMYLVRSRFERAVAAGKDVADDGLASRLPEAEVLDQIAYRTIIFGFPIWTFAIIAGAIWAEAAWGRYWGWDPKETWAFISWIVYAAYLHARATAGWRGTNAAYVNLIAFATMIFNFFVVNIVVSGLHSYSGLN